MAANHPAGKPSVGCRRGSFSSGSSSPGKVMLLGDDTRPASRVRRHAAIKTQPRRKHLPMHLELSRTYPVSRHEGFTYVMDVRTWPQWLALDVDDVKTSAWKQPGDTVRYQRKATLAGARVFGSIVLDEVVPDDLIGITLNHPGMPSLPLECRFSPAGPHAFTLSSKVHSVGPLADIADALESFLFIESFASRDLQDGLLGLDRELSDAGR